MILAAALGAFGLGAIAGLVLGIALGALLPLDPWE